MGNVPSSLDWEAEMEGRMGIKSVKKKKHLPGRQCLGKHSLTHTELGSAV